MRVFIVHAHHEPASFNGAMTRSAVAALIAAGHEAVVSDLYAMGFDPVSGRRNFTTVVDPRIFRQQAEESLASANDGFVTDLQAEFDKLAWCDVLVFQFPIWWLGMPAIMKGWIDKVFAVGRVYGGGRWFDGGMLVGKRAMCSVTLGAPQPVYSDQGVYGPIHSILYPIHRGIFEFTGMTVIEPFVVYAPHRTSQAARVAELDRYRDRMLKLNAAPTLPRQDLTGFDGLVRRRPAI
ncbi:Quinone family NAD [Mesorhizobium loti]|nr:Quinone family NAD [Mesorhizobium loti]